MITATAAHTRMSQESPRSGPVPTLRLVRLPPTRVRVVGETQTQEEKRHGITKKATVPKVTIVEAAEAIHKKMAMSTLGNMKTRRLKLDTRTSTKTCTQTLRKIEPNGTNLATRRMGKFSSTSTRAANLTKTETRTGKIVKTVTVSGARISTVTIV